MWDDFPTLGPFFDHFVPLFILQTQKSRPWKLQIPNP